MTKKRGCPKEPPIEPSPPYDELNHEVLNNRLTVRVPKNVGKIVTTEPEGPFVPSIHANCCSTGGNQCRAACAKLNVFPNEQPTAKKPDEEQTLIRTTRKIINSEEMRNILEVEFRTARNYEPLPPVVPFDFDPEAAAKMLLDNEKKRKEEKKNAKNK